MTIGQSMVIHKSVTVGGLAEMSAHPRNAKFIEFDDGNESELAAHRINAVEVTQLLLNEPTWAPNTKGRAGLWLAVGCTNGGRALTVPVAYDEVRRAIRPITGWDSTSGERIRYLEGNER